MRPLVLGSYNLYKLGGPGDDPARQARLGAVVAGLAADAWALQEVEDFGALDAVLGPAYASSWEGERLTSREDGRFRVVVAWRPERLALQAWQRVPLADGRPAVAARFTDRATGEQLVMVSAHLRAGYPDYFGESDARGRQAEAEALAAWLRERPDGWRAPAVLLGDLNAPHTAPDPRHAGVAASLGPLHALGWAWREAAPDPAGGGPWSVPDEQRLIDHALVEPPRLAEAPQLHAPDLREGPGPSDHRPLTVRVWPLRTTG